MPRKPDPTRKPELLGQILDHLTGRTLATVSFRTLAEALGVSTYVFVYHFGNRAQLVQEIVRAVVARQDQVLALDPTGLDADEWQQFLESAWAEVSSDHNRQLQRLEFEAAMLEMVDGDATGIARSAVTRWRRVTVAWALAQGLDPDRANLEATLFADAVYGLQYDALATGDTERVARAFALQSATFTERVSTMAVVAA
ncbi:TetR/AcrR family transcriptional regulator [Frondihabitans cladoniiphilus]|uniref:TetR family transcriptional regulator n=1 Tax=Frondihabitans cladoniiphilus TaxID=715785 RepID=A0ABP8VTB7_9MICO